MRKKLLIAQLRSIISQGQIKYSLDIGCGKGFNAIFMASYGIKVDVIEPSYQKIFRFPEYLKDHPNISHYDLSIEKFTRPKNYDLILCINVVMFLPKKFTVQQLLPKMARQLNNGGHLILAYFGKEDETSKNMEKYNKRDFQKGNHFRLISHKEIVYEEDHPPLGKHKHYQHIIVLKKTSK